MKAVIRWFRSPLALVGLLLLPLVLLLPLGCSSDEPVLAFHLVYPEGAPVEGALSLVNESTGETFQLHSEPFLTGGDVQLAAVERGDGAARVLVAFHPAGSRRLATVTADHVGDRIAIVVHGRLISAPIVRAPISEGRAVIDGGFTEEEALSLAQELNRSPMGTGAVSGPKL